MHIAGTDTDSQSTGSAGKNRPGVRVVTWEAALSVLRKYSVPDRERPQVLGLSEKDAEAAFRQHDNGNKGYLTESEWRHLCASMHITDVVEEKEHALQLVDFDRLSTLDVSGNRTDVPLYSRIADLAGDATERIIRFLEGFISGGVAGAVSKTVIAPGDRVKIIYQVDPNRQFSLRAAFKTGKRIVEKGGILSLWNGNGATMLRIVPYASITFLSFERYHDAFKWSLGIDEASLASMDAKQRSEAKKWSVLARFLAGSFAGATSTALTYPLDFMRARYAAHWDPLHPRYPSYYTAFGEVIRLEGWRTLYRGLTPTLVGIMPYAGSSFACFETVKQQLVARQNLKSDAELPVYQRLIAGSFSGLVAQSLTYPLDIVRRRMQVHPDKYATVLQALVEIYRHEGLRNGLYKGLAMNWIKGPIAVSCSFTVNDLVKHRIRTYHTRVVEAESDTAVNRLTLVEKCLCGGVAGAVAKFWAAPLDRMKIMYALGRAASDEHTWGRDGFKVMAELYQETPHMWQGAGAMMTRVVPYAALTYASFEFFEGRARRLMFTRDSNFATHFVGGAFAASLATVCLHPLDLLRTRNAAFTGDRRYASYKSALADLYRGGAAAMFEGVKPSILGIAPTAGLGFALYFHIRDSYECDTFMKRLAAGAFAGVVAQTATYPLNVIRRRAQVDHAVDTSILRSLTSSSSGLYSGLYHRMPLGWVLGATTVGLSFAINDTCIEGLLAFKQQVRESVWPKHLREAIGQSKPHHQQQQSTPA